VKENEREEMFSIVIAWSIEIIKKNNDKNEWGRDQMNDSFRLGVSGVLR
jgi:hypothetical protein